MSRIKVFNGGHWVRNSVESSFEDADLVIMPGGADWNPNLYGQKPNSHTNWFSPTSDERQWSLMEDAVKYGKIVFGICRGLQGLTILNGGTLIQHIEHPGGHVAKFKDGSELRTNSIHHQMCFPYNLPEDAYKVLAWTEELSPVHLGEGDVQIKFPEHALDENGRFKEPEVIYYPKTRSLGAQSHPEMMREGTPFQTKMNDYIWELFETGTIK